MKPRSTAVPFLLPALALLPGLLLAPLTGAAQEELEECTAGVASGKATADGRPLLWKTRDASATDNEVIWNTSGRYHFVSVISAGFTDSSWMGVNEKGFAIINTQSSDLEAGDAGPGNGTFMTIALRECATVEEFQALLDATNEEGRRTATNYGVLDATGAAAFFETAGHEYWRYDAADTEKGYILRSNFAINGQRGLHDRPGSLDRYLQTERLMVDFFATERIDFKEIVREQVRSFGDAQGNLVPLPITGSYGGWEPGFYPHNSSINRSSSVSFAIIQGVLETEDARLSTMWTILGQPSTGILVPYWPVGPTPPEADGPETAPLNEMANRIRRELYPAAEMEGSGDSPARPLHINTLKLQDAQGEGIWKITLPAEDSIIADAERLLEQWRATGVDPATMMETQRTLAARALDTLERAYEYLTKGW